MKFAGPIIIALGVIAYMNAKSDGPAYFAVWSQSVGQTVWIALIVGVVLLLVGGRTKKK